MVGKNADALWDMLTDFVGTPFEVEFIGFDIQENDCSANEFNLEMFIRFPKPIDILFR